MVQTHYHGIPEHGLPLVPQDAAEFAGLVQDINAHPEPFGRWPIGDFSRAAVMLNQTGRAIVALSYFWRNTTAAGQQRTTSAFTNLASSTQNDLLSGRPTAVSQDLGSLVLPGSKRLITDHGMFGNNLDVLRPQPKGGYTGYFGGGAGGRPRRAGTEEITQVNLVLDLAILQDGLCIGPDEGGLVQSLRVELELQRNTAQQVVDALHSGASAGQIFELLLALTRHQKQPVKRGTVRITASSFLEMFAQRAIHHLGTFSREELLAHFEEVAQSVPLRLHRAGPA